MKRREFIKISALSSAAIATLSVYGLTKEEKIEVGWFKNENHHFPVVDYNKGETTLTQTKPVVQSLIIFEDGITAFIIQVKKTQFKAVPINKKDNFKKEHFNQRCIGLANCYPEGKA
jgi:hypothetical protein